MVERGGDVGVPADLADLAGAVQRDDRGVGADIGFTIVETEGNGDFAEQAECFRIPRAQVLGQREAVGEQRPAALRLVGDAMEELEAGALPDSAGPYAAAG